MNFRPRPPSSKLWASALCSLRLPVLLPFHWWQSNHHKFRRHHMVSCKHPNTGLHPRLLSDLICVLTLHALPQCTVGHRDESADHGFLWPHRRRHEPVPVARSSHICVRRLRCLGQTVGHQRQHVPADLHGPRVGHQRHLCECAQCLFGPPLSSSKSYSLCKNVCIFASTALLENEPDDVIWLSFVSGFNTN